MEFLPIVLMMVVMYFLIIRPQSQAKKKLEETIRNLKKGDKVITQGGIIGRIWEVKEDSFLLALEGGAKTEITKTAIAQLVEK